MTVTVALVILAVGIAIGYCLPRPVARLRAAWRKRRYKPVLLRPVTPDDGARTPRRGEP